jgi:hypothetical protein
MCSPLRLSGSYESQLHLSVVPARAAPENVDNKEIANTHLTTQQQTVSGVVYPSDLKIIYMLMLRRIDR